MPEQPSIEAPAATALPPAKRIRRISPRRVASRIVPSPRPASAKQAGSLAAPRRSFDLLGSENRHARQPAIHALVRSSARRVADLRRTSGGQPGRGAIPLSHAAARHRRRDPRAARTGRRHRLVPPAAELIIRPVILNSTRDAAAASPAHPAPAQYPIRAPIHPAQNARYRDDAIPRAPTYRAASAKSYAADRFPSA